MPPRLSPVGGALLAAAQTLGWPVTSAFVEKLATATSAANGTANEELKHPTSRRQQEYA